MANEMNWVNECKYISDVTDKKGNVKEMNYSRETFVRYCEMQRNQATKEGRFDSAQYIQHCIDDLS